MMRLNTAFRGAFGEEPAEPDEILHRGGFHGGLFVLQIAAGPLEGLGDHVFPARQAQKLQNFVVASLHAVLGALRSGVKKGRGVNGLQVDFLRGQQGVGDGELVVDFIVSIGIQHHFHLASGALKLFEHIKIVHGEFLLKVDKT